MEVKAPVPRPVTTRATSMKSELWAAACRAPPIRANKAAQKRPLIRPIRSASHLEDQGVSSDLHKKSKEEEPKMHQSLVGPRTL